MDKKRKVLITGGSGFVGSRIAEEELKLGNEVMVMDTSNGNIDALQHYPGFRFVQGDILDHSLMSGLIADSDVVFHLAAICNPAMYCTDPDLVFRVNVEGTILVSKLCFEMGKKIVFSSSSEVYGKNSNVPWNEDSFSVISLSHLRWCYASSKIVGENCIKSLGKKGLVFAIGRFFNFYGPALKGRVIELFLDRFLRGNMVQVVAPGDQTRCFTYIDDAARGFMEVAHNPAAEGNVFNIGDTRETSIWELATIMKEIGEFESPIKIVDSALIYKDGYDDIPRRIPDTTRIRTLLGWEPRVTLEEGLRETIEAAKAAYEQD